MTEWTIAANPDSPDIAVLMPGTGYTAQAPLLYWCVQLLAERGWQVRTVAWQVPDDAEPAPFAEAAAVDAFAGSAGRRLVVGKSFGCFALPWAAREKVPGVWLTPITTDESLAAAIRGLTTPDLIIGGSADPLWDAAALAGSAAEVITMAEGDHALRHADGWRLSLDLQRRVFDAVSRHLDEVVHPA